jgi:hypothetical protein
VYELYLDDKKQGEYKTLAEAKQIALKSRARKVEFRLIPDRPRQERPLPAETADEAKGKK